MKAVNETEEFPIRINISNQQREVAMQYRPSAEARVKLLSLGALIAFSALASILPTNIAQAAAVKDYGKPGEPIELVIGYQPYYTESWSGVIMREKKFYEKYMPKGSKVRF